MPQVDGPRRGSAKRADPPKKKGRSVGAAIEQAAPKKKINFGPPPPKPRAKAKPDPGNAGVGGKSTGTVKLHKGTVKKVREAVDKNASGEGVVKGIADAGHSAVDSIVHLFASTPQGLGKSAHTQTLAAARTKPRDIPKLKEVVKVARTVPDDATDLVAGVIPSVYVPAREVARGKPGSAAKMLAEPFVETAKHPLKSLEEHPLQTALLASGAEALVGRGLGKGLRVAGSTEATLKKSKVTAKAAPAAKKARELGSTRRPKADTVVPGTHLRKEGRYSKDVLVKMGQAALDKADKRDAAKPRTMSAREQRRRANETEAAREDTVRRDRVLTGKQVDKLAGRKQGTIKALVQDNTVHPNRESVLAYLRQLEAEAATMTEPIKLKANAELRKAIEKDLKKADFGKIVEEVRAYREIRRPADEQRVAEGLVDKHTQDFAAEVPGAIQHEGARTARPSELAALVKTRRAELKDATKETVAAGREVKAAEAEGTHAQGRAEVLSRNVSGSEAAAVKAGKPRRRSRKASVSAVEPGYAGGGRGVAASTERVAHALNDLKDAQARQTRAAARSLEARQELQHGGYLRAPDGHRFTLEELQARREARGQEAPAFVTQAPRKGGARAHRVAPGEAVLVDTSKVRTGAATREGTSQVTGEVLREQAIRHKLEASAQEQFTLGLSEVALRQDGEIVRITNADRAHRVADNMNTHDPEMQWVAVRMNPTRGTRRQLDATAEEANASVMERSTYDDFNLALSGKDTRPGPYAIIPKEVAGVWRDHLQHNPGILGQAGFKFGTIWRKNVLGFSPKWITGNVVEANLRAAIAHAGPRSVITAVKVNRALEAIDPKAANQLRVRAAGGGNYGLLDRNNIHVEATTRLGQAFHELGKVPGPKHVLKLYDLWIDAIFHRVNGHVEYGYQMAMLGKALRDHPLMSEDLVKTSKAAAENMAQALSKDGKIDLNLMADLGRQVDDMYGKYGKFNPTLRRAIASYTPFIAWSLNSVKFLTIVLPRDHPVLTALLVSANQATEEWRKDRGLQVFATKASHGIPDYLKNSIPGEDGSMFRLGRYTPFGIMSAEGGVLGSLDELILPQFNGIIKNLSGNDWTGKKLRKDGDVLSGRNALAAGTSAIESLIPASGHLVNALDLHLPNQRDSATPRDADVWTRLRRSLDPFMYSKKPAPKGGGGGLPMPGFSGSGSMPGFKP